MSKYVIWDKQSNIITPIGEVLTPAQWMGRYPAAGVEGIKFIVGGGVVNGGVMMEFTAAVELYAKQGCDFTDCVTDQDYLDAIEAFEDAPQSVSTADQTRIADALEDLVVLQMPDVTPKRRIKS